MNCLVITPHRYGIREVAERIGTEWEKMGHEVNYELARGDAARIGPVTVGTPGIALWWYRRLHELAENPHRYDLIWTHQPVAPTLPTHNQTFWDRVIVTFHTTMRAEYELTREGIYPRRLLPYHWFTKTLEERFYRSLQTLNGSGPLYTVVSPHLREEIAQFGVKTAAYVPNGVFTPNREEFVPIRGEYGIPDDATLVVSVGSLTPQKCPVRFARTLRKVTEKDPNIHCLIAGDGPLRESVEEHTTDRIRTVGYISEAEKWRWLADADVFASLSAYEGMPVAAMEAISFDLPVVLSNIRSHCHVIEDLGAAGVLVEPIAADVLDAIQQLRNKSTQTSLATWHDAAKEYLRIAANRR